MLSVYSNLPKYRQLSYFELNQPKWKLETSNKWMKCFLDTYISHIMCLRKQKKLFSSADTANKIHHLKSPLILSVYHNLLYYRKYNSRTGFRISAAPQSDETPLDDSKFEQKFAPTLHTLVTC